MKKCLALFLTMIFFASNVSSTKSSVTIAKETLLAKI